MSSSSYCLLILGVALTTSASPAQTNLPLLTTAKQVHQLPSEQAGLSYPVRMQGVVTFCDESIEQLFVQNETGGMFVEINGDYGFRFHTGQRLEIEGVTAPGGFAPDVVPHQIRLLGTGALPVPRIVSFEQMAGGQEDCNWVQCSGIVRSAGPDPLAPVGLKLACGGGRVMVPIKNPDPKSFLNLVDAEVTLRGVCIAHFNRKRQLIQVAVQVSNMDDISVQRPAPAEPFAVRARKISNLLQYSPLEQPDHRVKVQGIVTLQRPGESLFIMDETQGLYIQTEQTTLVQPGDRVEVLGFPGAGEYVSPILQDAVFRKAGKAQPLTPLKIVAEDGSRDTNHAALVQIEATILNHMDHQRAQLLELQSGGIIFDAELDGVPGAHPSLALIPDGSRVLVTGVCLVPEYENWLTPRPRSFSLLLRSVADVTVVERPSWWTARHTLWVLAATAAVFCGSLAWVVVLRRQVLAQTRIISQKIQREAALEERSRIARDLHDDLGASLTHIGFLSEVARNETHNNPAVEEHLREISGSTQEAFEALDEIVWVVNPKSDTLDGLAGYICQFGAHFFHGTPTRCRFDLPPGLPNHAIPTDFRNNLFFAAKEALNNVRKHAAASEVVIGFSVAPFTEKNTSNAALMSPHSPPRSGFHFCISIEDNGQGFTPSEAGSARNGLSNMQQRLEKSGGSFVLESHPWLGTKVRLTVPL